MKNTFLAFFIAVLVPVGFFLYFDGQGPPKRLKLKRYIALEADHPQPNKILKKDTLWHTIADFEFLGHTGKKVTHETFADKIYVADFFFTHCPGICPKMTSQLQRLQFEYRDDDEVMILSHTVDPVRDTLARLAEYAENYEVDSSKWLLVTGDKVDLYRQARQSYKITATEGDGGEEDFVHSEKVVLIDKDRIIRGYYDGTDTLDVNQLMRDIKILQLEYPKDDNKIKYVKPTDKEAKAS